MLDVFWLKKAWFQPLAIIRAHGCDGLIYLMLGNGCMVRKAWLQPRLLAVERFRRNSSVRIARNLRDENGVARPNGFPKRNQVRRLPDAPDFSAYA
jgi:hypothetical protein